MSLQRVIAAFNAAYERLLHNEHSYTQESWLIRLSTLSVFKTYLTRRLNAEALAYYMYLSASSIHGDAADDAMDLVFQELGISTMEELKRMITND